MARARGLDSAPFGGLPGIAWAVLAAHTALAAGDLPAPQLLRHFFGAWAAWDWRTPVALPGCAPPGTADLAAAAAAAVTILTPSRPVRSCTDQVGPGLRDLLTQDLYQAWEGQVPVAPHRRHAAWAVLTVRAVPGEEFEVTLGRCRGRVRALLSAIEAQAPYAHAWPRAFVEAPGLRRYAIGLGQRPPEPATLALATAGWAAGVPGTRVDWAEGGAVATLR